MLASIVEKETGKAAERPMIAGVYCNRLRIGMKLDADPTVIYPVTKGKPLGRRILRSELNATTATTPIEWPGLPAGPIANPGKASIAAVLAPGPDQGALFRRRRHRRSCVRRHAGRAQRQCREMVRDPPRSGGRCNGASSAERLAPHIADAAVLARHSPRPSRGCRRAMRTARPAPSSRDQPPRRPTARRAGRHARDDRARPARHNATRSPGRRARRRRGPCDRR